VEFTLGCSPDKSLQVEVVYELVAEFHKLEEWHSDLKWPSVRICHLLLGSPSGRARLADQLEESARWLRTELAARREADAELEALWTTAAWVRDLVLDKANMSSSLATSLSTIMELLEGSVNIVATNRFCLGTWLTLVVALSHFPELETELELLKSRCNADLTVDHVDALWI
jgi:hypothetical protein